ncbi:MAG: glycosyltransferase family 9 protein [Ignavibacteriaceae bacterium]
MKNINLGNIDSVLIIRLSSLGDILLTTPLIRAIKKTYPGISIDMIVKRQYLDAIIHNPYLRNKLYYLPDQRKELLEEIQTKKYNLIIDLQNNHHSKKIMSGLSGIQIKFDKKPLKKFLLVQTKINLLKDAEQIPIRYANTLNELKLDDEGLDLITPLPPTEFKGTGNNLIGICPGGRHFTKMWPKDYYVKLCRTFIKNGWNVIMFGGLADRLTCLEIKNNVPEVINMQNDDNILQTAADMKLCRAIYCNDSGLMHAASAMKIPVIVFFGSTVKEFGFTPYNNRHIILEDNSLSCRPCSHIGKHKCPKKHFKCMREITPQSAYDSLKRIIAV